MTITEITKMKRQIESGSKLTEKEKKQIISYYSNVTKETDETELFYITLEAIAIVRKTDIKSMNEIFNSYINIPQELINKDLLKAIIEAGLTSSYSPIAISISSQVLFNTSQKENLIYETVSSILPDSTETTASNNSRKQNKTNIPESVMNAAKKLMKMISKDEILDYQIELITILTNYGEGKYTPNIPKFSRCKTVA